MSREPQMMVNWQEHKAFCETCGTWIDAEVITINWRHPMPDGTESEHRLWDRPASPEELIVQPTPTLQQKVKEVIADLDTETERIEAEVYWQHGSALILVGGETGYRKQQAIMVYDNGLKPSSAIVKKWVDGVRDTRI